MSVREQLCSRDVPSERLYKGAARIYTFASPVLSSALAAGLVS